MEGNNRNRGAWTLAVAAQIRAERAAAGMTQQQVMDRSGLPKSTYLRMESGERVADVGQLAAFCAAVGIPVSALMQRAEDRLSSSPTLAEHVIDRTRNRCRGRGGDPAEGRRRPGGGRGRHGQTRGGSCYGYRNKV